jgi:hypothetical protein
MRRSTMNERIVVMGVVLVTLPGTLAKAENVRFYSATRAKTRPDPDRHSEYRTSHASQ